MLSVVVESLVLFRDAVEIFFKFRPPFNRREGEVSQRFVAEDGMLLEAKEARSASIDNMKLKQDVIIPEPSSS